ncbi:MAG TPA: alpha/beta hydrolase [Mucilaginibacter sp.]|jgi:pimeloyl-ACP methyl ester carboxylesterase|nr:alpha/beta hydrolase [Mucilaginibacter sp.]
MSRTLFYSLIGFLIFLGLNVFAMQADSGKYYTSFDGVRIYYEVKGEGYPVVLIHGFTGTSQGWKRGRLYGDLLKAGYKVIIMDLPGNGRSDKPHTDQGYANNAEAKDVMGLLTALNIANYDVVGYSRGSIIASSLMVMDRRVNRTVLGGMGDAYTNPEWPRRIHFYKALMGDTSFHEADALIKRVEKEHLDRISFALQQKWQPSTSPQQLSKVKKPVLIVRGTEDKEEDNSETALQQMIPASELVHVPGDHGAASLNQQFSDAVMSFIR